MKVIFVTDWPQDWPFELAGSSVTNARTYLADAPRASVDARVINLCRSDRYQGRGYYVSLLAEARGHLPLPDVKTIEDLKSEEQLHAVAARLDPLVDETVHHDASDRFEIDSCFGRDPAGLHATLAQQLFEAVKAPLLRAHLARVERRWGLQKITAIGAGDVPSQHRALWSRRPRRSSRTASRAHRARTLASRRWPSCGTRRRSTSRRTSRRCRSSSRRRPWSGSDAYQRGYTLARSLGEALELLREDEALREILGDEFVSVYTEVKAVEHDEFMNVISPWEREHLLLHV